MEAARRLVAACVTQHNAQRPRSAIGYIAPAERLAARSEQIWATRDVRLEAARAERQLAHHAVAA